MNLFPMHLLLWCFVLTSPIQVQARDLGVLHFLAGDVRVDGRPAHLNMKIPTGTTVETGPGSIAEVRYGHETGIRIRENSRVKLDRPGSTYRILLAHGTILSLVKRKSVFEVKTPLAIAGVRGTVLFVHVSDDTSAYICTCNGKLDLLDGDRLMKAVSATHHKAYGLRGRPGNLVLGPEGMQMHTDVEIFEQLYRMEQEEP